MKITSSQNPRIKNVVKLKDRKTRAEQGLTLIDGVREFKRSMAGRVTFKEIFICPELLGSDVLLEIQNEVDKRGIPVYEVTSGVYEKIAFGERKEGIVSVCQPKLSCLSDLPLSAQGLYVIVENLEKPGNLGAILRTCDGVGADALLVSDLATDIFNPNVIRSSIGAVFSVPIVQADNNEIFQFLKNRQIKIVAATPPADQSFFQADFRSSVAIVLGSEEKGLSDFWLKQADDRVNIPMRGRGDSLNVSVTAAVLLYEALRQRGKW